jgi:hypothetical protein
MDGTAGIAKKIAVLHSLPGDECEQSSAPDQRREGMDAGRPVLGGGGDVGNADAEESRASIGELRRGSSELSPRSDV